MVESDSISRRIGRFVIAPGILARDHRSTDIGPFLLAILGRDAASAEEPDSFTRLFAP
jgi:hypothetical protein